MIDEIFENARKVNEQEEEVPGYFEKEFTVKLTGMDLWALKNEAGYAIEPVIDKILDQAGDFDKE